MISRILLAFRLVGLAMHSRPFPQLDMRAASETHNALHAYAGILGDCLKASRVKRKHWWHASLRPSLNGLSTGVVRAVKDFELELDFRNALLKADSSEGESLELPLGGQSAAEMARQIADFSVLHGISESTALKISDKDRGTGRFTGFSNDHAKLMGEVLASVAATLEQFRTGIPEETSPIQLWPHHFDLSMIWLPGEKIPEQDPLNEEHSDKQMNFGFTFGDEGISEPYFYVTAYPSPEPLENLELPPGAAWKTDAFTGAVVPYRVVTHSDSPTDYLHDLWNRILSAGRLAMLEKNKELSA
jgi:hypothetical protein